VKAPGGCAKERGHPRRTRLKGTRIELVYPAGIARVLITAMELAAEHLAEYLFTMRGERAHLARGKKTRDAS
jgi:hypothetical protein